jgi:hypothetical protein
MVLSASALSPITIVPIFVGALTLLLGALSLYVNTANAAKQARIGAVSDAYRAAIAWRDLADRVRLSRELDREALDALRDDYVTTRNASEYHLVVLSGQSRTVTNRYFAFSEAIRGEYEPTIIAALTGQAVADQQPAFASEWSATYRDPLIDYARAGASSASFFHPLVKVRLAPEPKPADWLRPGPS